MRFPRHARVFRGPADGFLFAGVLLLLMLLVMLHSRLTFVGGLPIQLPEGPRLPGVTNATVTVAVDARGQFYYLNQVTDEEDLELGLIRAVRVADGPLTLVMLADRRVPQEVLVNLMNIARTAGIRDALMATRPPSAAPEP
jgi:biopolymer transport protein ExbD